MYWEEPPDRGNSREMPGGGHVPGVCESRKGACGARMERTGEEGVRGVAEGGSWPGGVRWWFFSLAAYENFLGSFQKY